MRVKDLIETINIFDAKVIFDNLELCKDRVLEGKLPIYFTTVDGKEKNEYELSSNKSEFVSTTAAIHIPDLAIDEFIQLFECDITGVYEFTKEIIKPYCFDNIPKDIVYVVFVFLHEVGHWMQFVDMGNNVKEFESKDFHIMKETFDKVNQLQMQRIERLKRGITCEVTAKEKNLFKQYMIEYRQIPKEKEADSFALKHIQSTLNLYLKYNECKINC